MLLVATVSPEVAGNTGERRWSAAQRSPDSRDGGLPCLLGKAGTKEGFTAELLGGSAGCGVALSGGDGEVGRGLGFARGTER
jgi:hypothetical protein